MRKAQKGLRPLNQLAAYYGREKLPGKAVVKTLKLADWHKLQTGNLEWTIRDKSLKLPNCQPVQPASHFAELRGAVCAEIRSPANQCFFAEYEVGPREY